MTDTSQFAVPERMDSPVRLSRMPTQSLPARFSLAANTSIGAAGAAPDLTDDQGPRKPARRRDS